MATDHYRSAELIFGWSFYRQGTSGGTSSADEFFDAALHWFGDPDPRLGTAWEKGQRLAKVVAHRRTFVVLDGLEPLQKRVFWLVFQGVTQTCYLTVTLKFGV